MRTLPTLIATDDGPGRARKRPFSCLVALHPKSTHLRLDARQGTRSYFLGPSFSGLNGLSDHWGAMLIGYARVSTDDQNLDLQRDALRLAGCEKIYEDRISGAKAARPGLAMALEVARDGDVLTVWRLDRLGRKLDERGIGLMSVQERIDTSSSGGRLVFHMFGALAEFERNLVRERTQAGLNAARARGRKGGRPKVLEPAKRRLAVDLYNGKKHTVREICRMMGISKPTLYNYLAEAGGGV